MPAAEILGSHDENHRLSAFCFFVESCLSEPYPWIYDLFIIIYHQTDGTVSHSIPSCDLHHRLLHDINAPLLSEQLRCSNRLHFQYTPPIFILPAISFKRFHCESGEMKEISDEISCFCSSDKWKISNADAKEIFQRRRNIYRWSCVTSCFLRAAE